MCRGPHKAKVVESNIGWFNACSLLKLVPNSNVYPRGFPYYARHKDADIVFRYEEVDVHINAGLWLKDPDLDGITWLVSPVQSVSFNAESLVLGRRTWSPVNTQNTALRRDVIAAYYFVKMGYPLQGMPIDRYGDILSGYFAQVCMRHMGGAVRIGTPLVEHKRNSHNFMKDATNEWGCIVVLEDLLPWLSEVKLEGRTYSELYISLSYALEDIVEHFKGKIWTDPTRAYFHLMAYYMRKWAMVCEALL